MCVHMNVKRQRSAGFSYYSCYFKPASSRCFKEQYSKIIPSRQGSKQSAVWEVSLFHTYHITTSFKQGPAE